MRFLVRITSVCEQLKAVELTQSEVGAVCEVIRGAFERAQQEAAQLTSKSPVYIVMDVTNRMQACANVISFLSTCKDEIPY